MFQLARDLGKTIGELSQITSEEFTYWMAFYDHNNKETLKKLKKAKRRNG